MAVEAALAQLNDPARNALVPALVSRHDLVGANASSPSTATWPAWSAAPSAASWWRWRASPAWSSATRRRSCWAPRSWRWFARAPSRPHPRSRWGALLDRRPRSNRPWRCRGPRRGSVAEPGAGGVGLSTALARAVGCWRSGWTGCGWSWGIGGCGGGWWWTGWPRSPRGSSWCCSCCSWPGSWAGTERRSGCCGACRRSAGWPAARWWWGWPGGWSRGGCSGPACWCSARSAWPSGTARR